MRAQSGPIYPHKHSFVCEPSLLCTLAPQRWLQEAAARRGAWEQARQPQRARRPPLPPRSPLVPAAPGAGAAAQQTAAPLTCPVISLPAAAVTHTEASASPGQAENAAGRMALTCAHLASFSLVSPKRSNQRNSQTRKVPLSDPNEWRNKVH